MAGKTRGNCDFGRRFEVIASGNFGGVQNFAYFMNAPGTKFWTCDQLQFNHNLSTSIGQLSVALGIENFEGS